MSALGNKYYDNYDLSSHSTEEIFDELYHESRIRILREPTHFEVDREEEKVQEIIVKISEPFYASVLNILFLLGIVAVLVMVSSKLVTRHAELSKLQYQNSDIKRAIVEINKQKDICLLQKENAISMENLEKYAIEELGMIKAEQGNMLIIEEAANSYITTNVRFKQSF